MEIIKKEGVKGIRIVEHNKKLLYLIIAFAIILVIVIIYLIFLRTKNEIITGIENPASVYCIENNGTLKIIDNKNGSYGLCVFEDNSSCEEWAYFRGECKKGENKNIEPATECDDDNDCVPASCCHATSCINKKNAPNCREIMCTMDCVPGTLDCGGSCKCLNNKCTAVIL